MRSGQCALSHHCKLTAVLRLAVFCASIPNLITLSVPIATRFAALHPSLTTFLPTGCILCIKCLARELTHGALCSALQILLARDYFLITVLSAALCIATIGLGALLYVQLTNIASNITVNECINRARYPYLQDLQGQPRNRFDKGILTNWLEFLQVPGFAVDYTTLFDLPPELTQENMRLNEAMSKTKGMFGVNSNALHALFGTQSVSGPPSLDMEMTNRAGYAESTDSGDTGNSAEVFV